MREHMWRKEEVPGLQTHHKGHHFLSIVIKRLPPFLGERLEGVREGHTGLLGHIQQSADHFADEALSASRVESETGGQGCV